MRDTRTSRWIARRLLELHSVDLPHLVSQGLPLDIGALTDDDFLGIWQVLRKWTKTVDGILKTIDKLDKLCIVPAAKDQYRVDVNPLTSPARLLAWRTALDFPSFLKSIARFRVYIGPMEESTIPRSPRVLCHNDLLSGNVLLKLPGSERPDATYKDSMLVCVAVFRIYTQISY
jgi:thiamine kinase-like enzyme